MHRGRVLYTMAACIPLFVTVNSTLNASITSWDVAQELSQVCLSTTPSSHVLETLYDERDFDWCSY